MEVARALVLPDFSGPAALDLMSLLLVWDQIEVDLRVVNSSRVEENAEHQQLVDEGLVTYTVRPFSPPQAEISAKPESPMPEILESLPEEVWAEIKLAAFDDWVAKGGIENLISSGGKGAAKSFVENLQEAFSDAALRGYAPVAVTPFASMVSSLPARDDHAAITEATMIQVASKGIRVNHDTTVDDLLLFRERNAELMGRFRGALIDLAGAVDSTSPTVAAEQAYAVLVNRVEPALADLSDALDKGRIRFSVQTLLGATSIAAGPAAALGVSAASGGVATQMLRYAFDRERLVREHPYGLLYRAENAFGASTEVERPRQVITDPEAYIAVMLERMLRAASDVALTSLREDFAREAEGGHR